jgi:hypothetical protein
MARLQSLTKTRTKLATSKPGMSNSDPCASQILIEKLSAGRSLEILSLTFYLCAVLYQNMCLKIVILGNLMSE